MDSPYRRVEPRPESTRLRTSWWRFAGSLATAAVTGALTYVLFRYVADGWIGYAAAGLVGLAALAFLRGAADDRVGDCPRCGTAVETSAARAGYLCASCKSFLEIDRGQLLASRSDRVTERPCLGVQMRYGMELPDACCVCRAPTARRFQVDVGGEALSVPYCAEHQGGIAVRKEAVRSIWFRSVDYAVRTAEQNGVALVGVRREPKQRDLRAFGLAFGIGMSAAAALTYWGLSSLENSGYEIVPVSLKGLVLWLVIKLVGKKWLAAGLATLALIGFGESLASFRPRRARQSAPTGGSSS